MATLSIELPSDIALDEHDLKMMFAAKLYDEGILTAGAAAEMVGITKRKFLEDVPQYGVRLFADMTPEDVQREWDNAQWASPHLDKRMPEGKREYAYS